MSNFSTYPQKNYDGGHNDGASDAEVGRNDASYIRNWDITKAGSLVSRDGLTQYGSTVHATDTPINGFGELYRSSTGAHDLLVMCKATLYYDNSATFTALDNGFTSEPVSIESVPELSKVYISSTSNTIHSWDRASTTLNSCLTDLGATVPHGNVLRWHKNHMFTINRVTVSGTAYRNRLYWSAMGDPATWDTTNDFIPLPARGGEAVTVGSLGDALVIFKERATMYLTGWGDTDWQVTASASNVANADESVGTLSPFGGVQVGDEWWFIDDQGYIRRLYQTDYDAFRKDVISDKLVATLGTLNKAQLVKASAVSFGNKVIFSIPTGSSTYNNLNLVCDLTASKRNGSPSWTIYEGSLYTPAFWFVAIISSVPTLMFASGSESKIYKVTGTSDAGAAIACRWDGKLDDFNQPERYKKYAYGYLMAPNQGDVDALIYSSIQGGPYAHIATLNLAGSGSKLGPTGTFRLGPTGTNALGGAETLSKKFYYADGGGQITGKSRKLSIRCSETSRVTVGKFTDHFSIRSLR